MAARRDAERDRITADATKALTGKKTWGAASRIQFAETMRAKYRAGDFNGCPWTPAQREAAAQRARLQHRVRRGADRVPTPPLWYEAPRVIVESKPV